jgi:putative aldouronate transport system substrate-binding protein
MLNDHRFSRRGFLGLAGGLGATLALAGCGTGESSGGAIKGTTSTVILPGTAPNTWKDVLDKVNAKLQSDLGFNLDAQFINWSNFQQQALLKFTAGEKFDTALQALWLNLSQLQQSGSLVDVSKEISKYKNLSVALPDKLIKSNSWDGHLWGIPQVNSAARLQHFAIRQDLADKLGFSSIENYDQMEKFLYAAKQTGGGVVPYGASSSNQGLLAIPSPVGIFNAASWDDPHTLALGFGGKAVSFILAKDAKETGSSSPIPFWEDQGVVDTLHRIRKYHDDGIINADALNSDASTINSQWQAGKFAATWAMTDGLTSNSLVALQKAVPGAALGNVAPLKDGFSSKPNQTFQADNLVVISSKSGNTDRALQLQDWLSIQENHDLLSYGIEGKDWEAVDGHKFKQLSDYSFPGFALAWRSNLERKTATMSASEEKIFDWAQNYDNFTADTFASFIPDPTPVKQQLAALTNVVTQYANPLFYGLVDVQPQLDQLKRAADAAGLPILQAEMEKQANAYLKKQA